MAADAPAAPLQTHRLPEVVQARAFFGHILSDVVRMVGQERDVVEDRRLRFTRTHDQKCARVASVQANLRFMRRLKDGNIHAGTPVCGDFEVDLMLAGSNRRTGVLAHALGTRTYT